MAVVAGGGAVRVAINATVLSIGAGLGMIIVGMAVDTGKAGVIGGNLVAVVAHGLMMRDGEVRVIERSAEPRGGSVASFASGWITGSHVVRYGST